MLNFAKDDAGRRIVGDIRASQTGGLYMIHEIFTNFHDMVVNKLGDYEQARKFVGGTIQKILFDMWAVALGIFHFKLNILFLFATTYYLNLPHRKNIN